MAGTREEREAELQKVWTSDCIGLVRIYQSAIGTPHGQIPIPGIPFGRMIEAILEKEFPSTTLPRGGRPSPPGARN